MCHYDVLFISAPAVYSTYSCCGTFSTRVTKVQGPCLHQTNITSTRAVFSRGYTDIIRRKYLANGESQRKKS